MQLDNSYFTTTNEEARRIAEVHYANKGTLKKFIEIFKEMKLERDTESSFIALERFRQAILLKPKAKSVPKANDLLQARVVELASEKGLLWCCQLGYTDLARKINEFYRSDITTESGNTPMHYAVDFDHIETTKWLISTGANLDHSGPSKWTPLHYACRKGFRNHMGLLLDAGANTNSLTDKELTPMLIAVRKADWQMALILMKYGAKPQISKESDVTSLKDSITPILGAPNPLYLLHLCNIASPKELFRLTEVSKAWHYQIYGLLVNKFLNML